MGFHVHVVSFVHVHVCAFVYVGERDEKREKLNLDDKLRGLSH